MNKSALDSIASIHRPLTAGELDWQSLFESKSQRWNSLRESLRLPFKNDQLPDTIFVLLGAFGTDDAFTYKNNTVCFDITAYQSAYGNANLPGNSEKMDRIFAHEFTHLLHKDWARRNKLELKTFKDTVLWDCLYEGIGMYRSLPATWLPNNGVIPSHVKDALLKLYPEFIDNLAKIASPVNLSEEEKEKIVAHLSRGKVEQKWGALTVAIWLALEAGGDDKKLAKWINYGPKSIPALANKYLSYFSR